MSKSFLKYILLSHTYNPDTPSYGNRDKFEISSLSKISEGASSNTSKWCLTNNHIGTHIDVPSHFYDEGPSLSDYEASDFVFNNVQVIEIELEHGQLINYPDFNSIIKNKTDLLLIKTGYEKYRYNNKYWEDNPGLSADLGYSLRSKLPNLRAIGFDFISLTSWKNRSEGKKAHLQFLRLTNKCKKFIIIEDMSLIQLKKTDKIKKIIVSPFWVDGANGAPVTVFCELNQNKIYEQSRLHKNY